MTGPPRTPGDAGAPPSALDDDTLLHALEHATTALAAVPVDRLDAPVPSCPGWTLAQLLAHTTRIHRWATAMIGASPGDRVRFPPDDAGTGAALTATVARNAEALLAALRATDRARVVPTFVGDRPVRWWLRRQTHETVVHAWDAASALGEPAPIDAPIAVDGIDELLDVFLVHRFAADAFGGTGEAIHLHATDVAGEWLIRFDPAGPVVTRAHAKGDVAARGPASDLLLFLWSRVAPTALETFGDVQLLERYQATASF